MSQEKIFDMDQEVETMEENEDMPEEDISPKYFQTNIEELNLLGEDEEGEPLTFIAPNDDSEFRIGQLDL